MLIKAWKRGWLTRRFPEMKMFQARETSSRGGHWSGYFYRGEASYYTGIPFPTILLKTLFLILKTPHYIFLPFFLGYLYQFLVKREKIPDQEVIDFYRKDHLRMALGRFVTQRKLR